MIFSHHYSHQHTQVPEQKCKMQNELTTCHATRDTSTEVAVPDNLWN